MTEGQQMAEDEYSKNAYRMKRLFTEAVAELLDEVESAQGEIAAQALEHIHASCVHNAFRLVFTTNFEAQGDDSHYRLLVNSGAVS